MSTPEFRERRRLYMADYRKRLRGEPMPHEQVVALASAARSQKAAERRAERERERSDVVVKHDTGRQTPGVGTFAERYDIKPAMTQAEYMRDYYGARVPRTATWSSARGRVTS